MQLSRAGLALAVALAAVASGAGSARGDGEVEVRGVYYKERATRVVQPMMDARLELDDATELELHTLVDAITSASVSAGAAGDAFTERRYQAGAALSHGFGVYRCGLSARGSYEPDYRSLFGGARCQAELAQRNTVLGLALAFGRDTLSNAGAQGELAEDNRVEGTLRSALMSLSASQVLSPVLIAGVTYDLLYGEGFLANPYRRVPVGGGAGSLEPEHLPGARLRHAVFGTVRGFVPQTRSTWIAGYRYYIDDWGVRAHTPELRLVQELVPRLDVHARYRYHTQRGASFYEPRYEMLEPYLTSDVKLSDFHSHTVGVELQSALAHLGVSGNLAQARIELVIEYVVQRNRLGNAVVAQTALAVPFEY
ncbi:DUF3570 domain-containing protein [Haliangium sp.]|uniref:DUF3570 domain-containing protein n=1 Tax=Haliangium sp. TaxID=2663208 RepID=UPI003D0EA9CE